MTTRREPKGMMSALLSAPVTRTATRKGAAAIKSVDTGKPFNIYLHPDDRKRLRVLNLYLSSQTERLVSDSQVLKAAMLAVQTNGALIEAFHVVAGRDRRFKQVAE